MSEATPSTIAQSWLRGSQIAVRKKSTSKECIVCHYWHYLYNGFKFQHSVCNGSHDVLMMPMNLNDSGILNICNVDYGCVIDGICKSESINLFKKWWVNMAKR